MKNADIMFATVCVMSNSLCNFVNVNLLYFTFESVITCYKF